MNKILKIFLYSFLIIASFAQGKKISELTETTSSIAPNTSFFEITISSGGSNVSRKINISNLATNISTNLNNPYLEQGTALTLDITNSVRLRNITGSRLSIFDIDGFLTNSSLTEANILTETEANLIYVPLIGATLTGPLYVTSLTNNALTASRIVLSDANKALSSSSLTEANILTESEATSIYIPLSGATMTGPLYVTSLTNNNLTASRIVLSDANKALSSSSLTEANILTESEATSLYVPLSGATMTGPLLITALTNSGLTANRIILSDANKALTSSSLTENNILTESEAAANYQPANANLTNWSNITTASKINTAGDTMSGSLSVTGLTNTGLNASRIVLSDVNKALSSSTLTEANILTEAEAAILYQPIFTTGAGITNIANIVSANLTAGSNISLSTNSGGSISISSTASGGTSTSNNIPSSIVYTDTNIFINAGAATLFRIILTNSAFLHFPTNASDGQQIRISITQDSTGMRLLSYTNSLTFGSDITGITLTTNANKTDWITMIYWAASNRWDVVGVLMGY